MEQEPMLGDKFLHSEYQQGGPGLLDVAWSWKHRLKTFAKCDAASFEKPKETNEISVYFCFFKVVFWGSVCFKTHVDANWKIPSLTIAGQTFSCIFGGGGHL